MTSREIILANLNHTDAPRCGMNFGGGRLNDFLGSGVGAPAGYQQKRWTEGNKEYYDDIWGNLWMRMVDGCKAGEVVKPAIEDWSQLEDYQLPVVDLETATNNVRNGYAQFSCADERFKVCGIPGWIFSAARYIRKMENYFLDMAMYPEELNRLHTMIAEVIEVNIRAAGQGGADAIFFCEDMGTQQGLLFSPEMWRQYFAELYTRLFGLAHEFGMKVIMHSCGRNREIIPDLIDAGVDAFQLDQPTLYDMDELAELFRQRKVALHSPVDIQKIMPTGDRETIVNGAREMCRTFDGFLIGKNYPDLVGIGVDEQWDRWAYEAICEYYEIPPEQWYPGEPE